MLLSKNALGNLINRYKAVLKKCNLLNNFSCMLKNSVSCALLAGALLAPAFMPSAAQAFQIDCVTSESSTICGITFDAADHFLLEPVQSGTSYVSNISLPGSGTHGLLYKNPADQTTYSNINDLLSAIIPQTVEGRYVIAQGSAPAGSIAFNIVVNGVTTPYYVTPLQTPSLGRLDSGLSTDITGGAFYGQSSGEDGGAILNENINGGYNINADFFENTAVILGGAIANVIISIADTKASLGDIKGTFIANNSTSANGGAIANTVSGTNSEVNIGDIDAIFIANNSTSANGGAIANTVSGTNSEVNIGDIDATFIANTAYRFGGAIHNIAYSNATASIGDINASFIANTAFQDGGAVYNSGNGNNSTASIDGFNATFIANTTNASGGAIANATNSSGSTASIGNINAAFIANTAVYQGGAIYNRTNTVDSAARIGDITGTFVANTAESGGAIINATNNLSSTASIENITASFMANTASGDGGAIHNFANNTSSIVRLGNITGSFIANTAGQNGGAVVNYANNATATADIGNINADFIANIADRDGDGNGLGGAIYTNRSLDFLADSKMNIFSGNMDSTGYNAIHIVDSGHGLSLDLDFNMQQSGSFMLNDSITANVPGAYDVNIEGEDATNNIFYLNNAITGVNLISVTNATLSMGSVTHADGNTYTGKLESLGSVEFGAYSTFVVDANNLENNTVIKAATTKDGSLRVADTARLHISGVSAGDSIKIVEGFTYEYSTIEAGGWSGANLTTPSSLLVATAEDFDPAVGDYTVTINAATAEHLRSIYPDLSKKTAQLLTGVDPDDVDSYFAALFSDKLGKNAPRETTLRTEALMRIAHVAGLQRTGFNVGKSFANNILGRLANFGIKNSPIQSQQMGTKQGIPSGSSVEGEGLSAGQNGQNAQGMKNGVALWISPLYQYSNVHGVDVGAFKNGYETGLGGLTLGADYTFNDIFRVGLAFNVGAGYTESTGDFYDTNNDFDFWGLSLYGGLSKDNFTLMADVGYSSVYGELTQDTAAGLGFSTLKADTQSDVWTVGLTAAYTFKTDFIDITPHAGVRYMHVTTYGFDTKSNGVVQVHSGEINQGVWYFPVGVTFSKDIVSQSGWTFTPKLDLGFIAAAGELDARSVTSIPGVAGSAEYSMKSVDGFAFNGGVGFDLAHKDNGVSVGVNYNVQASEHETSHMVNAVFKFEF